MVQLPCAGGNLVGHFWVEETGMVSVFGRILGRKLIGPGMPTSNGYRKDTLIRFNKPEGPASSKPAHRRELLLETRRSCGTGSKIPLVRGISTAGSPGLGASSDDLAHSKAEPKSLITTCTTRTGR